MPKSDPMTAAMASQQFGIPKRTILAAVSRGDIRSVKLGGVTGAHLLNERDVEKFVRTWRSRSRVNTAEAG